MATMIWKTYKYLYYRLYIWYRKKFGDSDLPEYSVIMVMSLNIMCNFASLVIIISIIKDVMIIPMNVSKTWALLPLFILLIIHYFAFIHRGRYRKIEKEFKKERKDMERLVGGGGGLYDPTWDILGGALPVSKLFSGLKLLFGVTKTFFNGAKYSPKVISQMGKTNDIYHAFPKSIDV